MFDAMRTAPLHCTTMRPVTKLYLKLFGAFTALLLVCSGGPALAIIHTADHRANLGLAAGVTILVVLPAAALMALFLGILQTYPLKKLGLPLTDENLSVRPTKTVVLPFAYPEALHRCLAAVRALRRTKSIDETRTAEGILQARTGLTWDSAGERIELRLRRKNDNWTMVTVSSRKRVFTWLVDGGRNIRNVEKIIALLQSAEAAQSR